MVLQLDGSRQVLAEVSDNMDLSRLPKISAKDLIRYKQYQKVQELLKEAHAIHQHVNALDLDAEFQSLNMEVCDLISNIY